MGEAAIMCGLVLCACAMCAWVGWNEGRCTKNRELDDVWRKAYGNGFYNGLNGLAQKLYDYFGDRPSARLRAGAILNLVEMFHEEVGDECLPKDSAK